MVTRSTLTDQMEVFMVVIKARMCRVSRKGKESIEIKEKAEDLRNDVETNDD